jgi:hypothetical protein
MFSLQEGGGIPTGNSQSFDLGKRFLKPQRYKVNFFPVNRKASETPCPIA